MTKATETKEVATTEEAGLPADTNFDDGLGELDSSDLIIPRLVVAQDNSVDVPDEAKGTLYCDVTGDSHTEMNLAIIKFAKSRILFPEKYKKGNDPLCRSHDFITPADDIDDAMPMSDNCADCDYSKWSKGNTPPSCNECWNLLVVDLDSYLPAWFTLKSTALKTGRKLISALKMRSSAQKIPVWGFSFSAAVEERVGDSGNSYIPTFSGITVLDGDDRENMNLIRQQLAGEGVQSAAGEEDNSDAENKEPAPEDF